MSTRSRGISRFYRARPLVIQQAHINTAKRKLETVALTPEDDGFLYPQAGEKRAEKESDGPENVVLPLDDTLRPLKPDSPVNSIRDALLGFQALRERRDQRLQVLRSLSNAVPLIERSKNPPFHAIPAHETIAATEAPIPHNAFRHNVKMAQDISGKALRQVMREQLLRCEYPLEIKRVIAVAMLKKKTASHFVQLYENIIRALYRCRAHVSDPEVLILLGLIVARFKKAELPVNRQLLQMGLKFAARARSLGGMERYLRECRERDTPMNSHVFRSVIAKCSIGHRGLGEIRNGRWRRDQLMQVLNGFEDCVHLPSEQQYHLGTWLDRHDWQYLHGWVAILARCKASKEVWQEWQMWKVAEARMKPRGLVAMGRNMDTKVRGDYWFVEQMAYSGDLEKAWNIVSETGIDFRTLKTSVKGLLVQSLEHAPASTKIENDEEISIALLEKYDRDLKRIEAAFGVQWQPGPQEGDGQHVLIRDQEEALEELSDGDFTVEEDYGFPWEISPIVPPQEWPLHDAKETVPPESSVER